MEEVMNARRCFTSVVVSLVVLTLSTVAQAQIRRNIPEDSQPPIYADFGLGFLPHTDEWAVVIFYRTPACVPADFNLLDFFDAPPRPFSCALHIEGFTLWRSLDDPFPAQIFLHGTGAVPVWFVGWPELQSAIADGDLTIGELAALPSLLVGSASFFLESERNSIVEQRGGNEVVVASGTLTDGRSFQVEFTEKFREGQHLFPEVRIDFR
jgi:hypothetical protein